jgi:HPt (histidine-containing phosphotransfer) domain-containing protein
MTDFEAQVLADLSALKAQMKELLGNGQPGRLARLEGRIDRHERTVQRLKGAAGALGAALTFAHFAIDFLFTRR